MKVICNRGALLDGLLMAGNVVASRTPKPVLQCVKLTAEENTLTIAATDLEVAIRYSDNQVQIERAGEALVPADKLRDIVANRSTTRSRSKSPTTTRPSRGRTRSSRSTRRTQGVPAVPIFRATPTSKSPAGTSSSLSAKRSSPRQGVDALRVQRRARRREGEDDQPRQHRWPAPRASQGRHQQLRQAPKEGVKAIVPAKALQLIDKLIDDPEAAFPSRSGRTRSSSTRLMRTLTSNLSRASFRRRRRHSEGHRQGDDRRHRRFPVGRAARRVADDRREQRRAAGVREERLEAHQPQPEAGEAEVNFPCKFEGSEMEIGFNPQFLTEALRVVDTDDISLELTLRTVPVCLRAGRNFLYVIMPVNLQ
jgi:DNA polymerase-3 subunit beta